MKRIMCAPAFFIILILGTFVYARAGPLPDTGQSKCYDDSVEITCPEAGEDFYGQDAQHTGNAPSYTDNGDGTITDNVTGLMWQKSPDTDEDGDIDANDKLTYDEALTGAGTLGLGGYNDWRLPTIKELYSLIDFSGIDPSGYEGTETSGLVPFIDTTYFDFAYGEPAPASALLMRSTPPATCMCPIRLTTAAEHCSVLILPMGVSRATD
jgi:hypothetical protein